MKYSDHDNELNLRAVVRTEHGRPNQHDRALDLLRAAIAEASA